MGLVPGLQNYIRNLVRRKIHMYSKYRRLKYLAFTVSFIGGMSGPAALAADHSTTETHSERAGNSQFSRSMVRNVQRELKNRGFYNGAIDGINSSQTRTAV